MFPEWLEEKLRPIDDAIIEFVQFFHNPFVIVVTQCISSTFNGWMDGWIDGWMDGWMDGYLN